MLHDLVLLDGGTPHALPPSSRCIEDGNLVYVLRAVESPRAPDAAEVLALVKDGFLPAEIRHLARYVVEVFLEMCSERWEHSARDVGLVLSLSTETWDPKSEISHKRLGVAEPEWSLVVREGEEGGVRYHVHLPPSLDDRVVVPICRFWTAGRNVHGVRNLVTFVRDGDGWLAVDHVATAPKRGVRDTLAVSPFDPAWKLTRAPLVDGAPRPPGA